MFLQAFINTVTAGTITTDTIEYAAQLVVVGGHIGTHFRGEKRTYVLDHEEVRGGGVYPFVRFHWLNRKGGIDSFTFKRNVTEGISVNKTFFERVGARTNNIDRSMIKMEITGTLRYGSTQSGGKLEYIKIL